MRKLLLAIIVLTYSKPFAFAQRSLQIGVLVPRSGELRNIGNNFIRGLRLGVKEPVVLRVFDTEGKISKTRRILRYLQTQKIDLIVGPLTSREIYGVMADLSRLSIPIYSPLAYLPKQCELENLFGPIKGLCAKVDYLVSVIEKRNDTKGVFIYSKTPEDVALSLYLRELLQKRGLSENWKFLSFDEKRFSYPFLDAYVDSTKPDILIIQSGDVAMLGVINYVRYLGYLGPVITLKNLHNDSTIINGLKLDTIYFLATPSLEPLATNRFGQFRWKYKKEFNEAPDFAAIRGFETGLLIDTLFTLYSNGNTDTWAILKSLEKTPGEFGNYLISSEGDLIFYLVTNGKVKEVKPDVIRKAKKEQKGE